MKFVNDRISVTIPDSTWTRYVERAQGNETAARGHVLSDAMVRLAHAWERDHWTPTEASDADVRELALRILTMQYFRDGNPGETCAYDVGRLLERWDAGAMMSPGQIEVMKNHARAWALNNLDEAALDRARANIALGDEIDRRYHEKRAMTGGDGWEIEIIGPMPSQIGLCRYGDEP